MEKEPVHIGKIESVDWDIFKTDSNVFIRFVDDFGYIFIIKMEDASSLSNLLQSTIMDYEITQAQKEKEDEGIHSQTGAVQEQGLETDIRNGE